MATTSSGSEVSSATRKKRLEKKHKKAGKKEKKDSGKRKRIDKRAKKQQAKSSGSSASTSAGGRARKKAKKSAKKSSSSTAEEAQQRWILGREKAIRKAEPDLPKDEALKRAVAEYMQIYDVGLERRAKEDATAGAVTVLLGLPSIPDSVSVEAPIRSAHVAETIVEAVREATQAARAAGRPETEVQVEASKAREAVLRVAEQAGLYKAGPEKRPEEMSLFLQEKDRELQEYVRKGVPSTDDRPRHVARASEPGQLDLTRLRLLPQV